MKFFDKARLPHLALLVVAGGLGIPTYVWGLGTVATGFQTSTTEQEVNAHGVCHGVYHSGGTSYFVPTKTASEWTAFRNYKPGSVSLDECPSSDFLIRHEHRGNTNQYNVNVPAPLDELYARADIHCNAYGSHPFEYAYWITAYVGDGQRSGLQHEPGWVPSTSSMVHTPLKYLTETNSMRHEATESIGCTNDARIYVEWTGTAKTTACGPANEGKLVGGYCWYLGNTGQSCNAVCSGRGGCNLTGTRNYAGSGGSLDNCATVLGHMGKYSYEYGDSTNSHFVGVGCSILYNSTWNYSNIPARRYNNGATTCAATESFGNTYMRACACNTL